MLVAFPVNATVWKALKVDIIPSALRTELLKVDSRIYCTFPMLKMTVIVVQSTTLSSGTYLETKLLL